MSLFPGRMVYFVRMKFRPRHLIIRHVLPLVWRFSGRQRLRALQEFSVTELDSAWQSVHTLQKVGDPKLQAALFQHALEERHHSDLFGKLHHDESPGLASSEVFKRKPIVEAERPSPAEVVEFLAFLAVGESEINRDFEVYARAVPSAALREIVKRIQADEELHEAESEKALVAMAVEHGVSLPWIRFRHLSRMAFTRYSRFMSQVGTLPLRAFLFICYIVLGSVFHRQAAARFGLPREKQFRISRDQVERAFAGKGAAV